MEYNKKYFKNILPKRPKNSHKGTFGHVLNVAGSGFYTGAAYFSSISPLKVGCGIVTLASAETVLRTVSALSPDIVLLPLDETKEKTISSTAIKNLEKIIDKFNAVSIGCGISTNKETEKFFLALLNVLNQHQIPVVIDADGLNLLALQNFDSVNLPINTILTPHPRELSRLMGVELENILSNPDYWVKKCCEKYNCTTVLKLHNTIVADNNGNFYVNNTGNSALSHGGSGDVLCGMITGFLAQGVNIFESSILAVYLHGLSAEIASKELTEYSVLSSDLLNYIPKAIKTILLT